MDEKKPIFFRSLLVLKISKTNKYININDVKIILLNKIPWPITGLIETLSNIAYNIDIVKKVG